MLVLRKLLADDIVTEYSFDCYDSPWLLIKNETGGEILFCDERFSESKALHVPAYSWQRVNIKMFFGEKPCFYVKAAVAGYVEIDMGSDGMGCCDPLQILDNAGMVPHILSFSNDENTTLTVHLTRKHGESVDLDTPVPRVSGETVYTGDIVKFTCLCLIEGSHAVLSVNSITRELDENNAFTHVVVGDVAAACTAEADEPEGD